MTTYSYSIEIDKKAGYWSKDKSVDNGWRKDGLQKRLIFFYTYPEDAPTVVIYIGSWYHFFENADMTSLDPDRMFLSDEKMLKASIKEYYEYDYPEDRIDLKGNKLPKITTRNITYKETFESPRNPDGTLKIQSGFEPDNPFDASSYDNVDKALSVYYDIKTYQWIDPADDEPTKEEIAKMNVRYIDAVDTGVLMADVKIEPLSIQKDQDKQKENEELIKHMESLNAETVTLTKTIVEIKNGVVMPPPPVKLEDFEPGGLYAFMTENQIMKKMMVMGSGMMPGPLGSVSKVDEKTAHLIIYGKEPMYDANGKIIDNEVTNPECVNKERGIPDTHPMKDKIKEMKKELKDAFMQVCYRAAEITKEMKDLIVKLALAAPAMVEALLPPKPTPTTALAILQSMMSDISKLVSIISQITPFLAPLQNFAFVLPSLGMVTTIFGLILTPIKALNATLGGFKQILTFQQIITGLIGQATQAVAEQAAAAAAGTSGTSGTNGTSGTQGGNNGGGGTNGTSGTQGGNTGPSNEFKISLQQQGYSGNLKVTINSETQILTASSWTLDILYQYLSNAFQSQQTSGKITLSNAYPYIFVRGSQITVSADPPLIVS